jgi:23S rRNA pseudouridine2605 synthase
MSDDKKPYNNKKESESTSLNDGFFSASEDRKEEKKKESNDFKDKKKSFNKERNYDNKKPYSRDDKDRKPYARDDKDRKPYNKDKKPYSREDRDRKPYSRGNSDSRKKDYGKDRPFDKKKRFEDNDGFQPLKPYKSDDRDSKPYNRDDRDKKPYNRDNRDRKPYSREDSDDRRKDYGKDRSFDKKKRYGDKDDFQPFKPYKKYDRDDKRSFDKSKFDKPRYKKPNFEEENRSLKPWEKGYEDEKVRLNKFIANSGVCNRREADELIKRGEIKVNGKVVTEMGFKVSRKDKIEYDGRLLKGETPIYFLLNKPSGYGSGKKDFAEGKSVMTIMRDACEERIFPVGKMDKYATGLLLLTNDQHLNEKLLSGETKHRVIYQVDVLQPVTEEDLNKLKEGVKTKDFEINVVDASLIDGRPLHVGIELAGEFDGAIRKLFEMNDIKIKSQERVCIAHLTKKDLAKGKYRMLSDKEVALLKMI